MKAKFIYESIDNILKPKSEEDIIKELSKISKKDLDKKFLYAIKFKLINQIDLLIKAGANVNFQRGKFTPLHYAIFDEDINIIKMLLDKGANVNIKNSEGETPLKYALSISFHRDDIIDLLKKYGAKE